MLLLRAASDRKLALFAKTQFPVAKLPSPDT
jgi:hypothetical protein